MTENLKTYIRSFIEARVSEICSDIEQNNMEYRNLDKRISELQQEIMGKLSIESGHLFLDYDDAENQQEFLMRINVYRQGLADGIRISRLLNRVNKD